MTGNHEQEAIDASQRISELKAVARRLWPDRDDPHVLSELHGVLNELRQAEQQLKAENA